AQPPDHRPRRLRRARPPRGLLPEHALRRVRRRRSRGAGRAPLRPPLLRPPRRAPAARRRAAGGADHPRRRAESGARRRAQPGEAAGARAGGARVPRRPDAPPAPGKLRVEGELGWLRRVLVCSPGEELRRVPPAERDRYLVEDLLWLERA